MVTVVTSYRSTSYADSLASGDSYVVSSRRRVDHCLAEKLALKPHRLKTCGNIHCSGCFFSLSSLSAFLITC